MSASKRATYCCTPAPTRGKPVVVSADPKNEKILYVCGTSVVIRNINNPLECDLYGEHSYPPTVAKYSPSGFYIASGDSSGRMRIWDTVNMDHVLKIELPVLGGTIADIAWSGDSQRLCVVGEGRERFGAAITMDGASVGAIDGHSKPITSCDFKSSRPFRVATGSEDFASAFFSGPPFKFTSKSTLHTRFVNCVRFSPNGEKFVTVGSDKQGFVYDGKSGEKIGELAAEGAHDGGIYACSWSPDGNRLLTASGDKTAKVWDMNSYACLQTFTFGDSTDYQQLGCLWSGENMITVSLNGELNYLDPANPDRPRLIVRGHNKFVTALSYDASRNQLLSASFDGKIIAWNMDQSTQVQFAGAGHTNQVSDMDVSGDNLISVGMDDSIRITPLGSKTYGACIAVETPVNGVAAGKRDPDLVVAACNDGVVVIRGGSIVAKVASDKTPSCVAISQDEQEVAVGCADGVRLFSLNGANLTQTKLLDAHRGAVTSVQYSPDGSMLASCDTDRNVKVFNRDGSVKIDGWCFHAARVNSVSWSPDSAFLVTGSLDSNIIVWSIDKPNSRINIAQAHKGGVNCVKFISNELVASAGQDCCVKTWNISTK